MAHTNDDRVLLLVGQAERLRNDTRRADEPLRQGKIDEAREIVARSVHYARAIAHELTLAIELPRAPQVRGKSRNR